jgi:hypothetical protein
MITDLGDHAFCVVVNKRSQSRAENPMIDWPVVDASGR